MATLSFDETVPPLTLTCVLVPLMLMATPLFDETVPLLTVMVICELPPWV